MEFRLEKRLNAALQYLNVPAEEAGPGPLSVSRLREAFESATAPFPFRGGWIAFAESRAGAHTPPGCILHAVRVRNPKKPKESWRIKHFKGHARHAHNLSRRL